MDKIKQREVVIEQILTLTNRLEEQQKELREWVQKATKLKEADENNYHTMIEAITKTQKEIIENGKQLRLLTSY